MPDCFGAIAAIAEQRIREAQEQGAFANLPGEGSPLELEDMSAVPPDLRMAYKILKNAGCLPEELQMRKEIIQITDLLDSATADEARTRALARLRYLLEKTAHGRNCSIALEANEEYLQKALAKLARFGG